MDECWPDFPPTHIHLAEKARLVINSIVRASSILNLFRERKSLSLKEIGELSGLHKTTAHGIVLTLLAERLLSQNRRTKRYSLGPVLFELGSRYRQRIDAFGVSLPFMRELSQKTGLTVQLAILNESDVIYLSRVVTREFMGFSSADGVRVSAHCTASGKSMLALLSEEALLQLFPDDTLAGRTSHSITSRDVLFRELEKIRADGYAQEYQEAEVGLAGMAAGFRADNLMAISVPLTAHAVDEGKCDSVVEPLLTARAEITRQLGAF